MIGFWSWTVNSLRAFKSNSNISQIISDSGFIVNYGFTVERINVNLQLQKSSLRGVERRGNLLNRIYNNEIAATNCDLFRNDMTKIE